MKRLLSRYCRRCHLTQKNHPPLVERPLWWDWANIKNHSWEPQSRKNDRPSTLRSPERMELGRLHYEAIKNGASLDEIFILRRRMAEMDGLEYRPHPIEISRERERTSAIQREKELARRRVEEQKQEGVLKRRAARRSLASFRKDRQEQREKPTRSVRFFRRGSKRSR